MADILAKFDSFAIGEINECYERLVFHNRNQQQSEPFEQFLTSIRVLVKSCNACRNSTLRDRIVLGVIDRDVQEALLKERNISLERTIDICRAAEHAKSQSKAIRSEEVNKIDKSRNLERRNNAPWHRNQQSQHDSRIDRQTVQAVSIAVANINRMKRVLQRGKVATSVSSQTTSRKYAEGKSRQIGRCARSIKISGIPARKNTHGQ